MRWYVVTSPRFMVGGWNEAFLGGDPPEPTACQGVYWAASPAKAKAQAIRDPDFLLWLDQTDNPFNGLRVRLASPEMAEWAEREADLADAASARCRDCAPLADNGEESYIRCAGCGNGFAPCDLVMGACEDCHDAATSRYANQCVTYSPESPP